MPDTTNYMILGYAAFALLLSGLIAYLMLKSRHLRAEIKTLQEMIEDNKQNNAQH